MEREVQHRQTRMLIALDGSEPARVAIDRVANAAWPMPALTTAGMAV
jgi:hypothetical protein